MDYSKLSDAALNQVIAEKLGYELYSWGGRKEYLMLVAPHEREYGPDEYEFLIGAGGDYARRLTVDEAWDDVPKWATDLNEALSLIESITDEYWREGFMLTTIKLNGVWYWRSMFRPYAEESHHFSQNESASRAICEAWLQYSETVKARGQQ